MLLHTTTQLLGWLLRGVAAEWQGPQDLPRALKLEWRLIAVRWVGMVIVGPVLPFMGLSTSRLIAAYAIFLFAVVYNIAIRWYLQRRPELFADGYVTTVADSVLNTAMIVVGGGFSSPFSYVLFAVTLSIAMRYGYGPALAMSLLFVVGDGSEKLIFRQPLDAELAFRSGFLFITALMASYLRRLAVEAEQDLHERLVELQGLYSDLAIAHQELLSLDEAKTNFLANVSHELRTPLTSIRAFSEMLMSYEDDESIKREFLEIITSETERLTRLVNDVLDVTKIESGEMGFCEERVDLAALLDTCARAFVPLLERSRVQFRLQVADELPPILGDHDRLQQVIQNLLNNALKFTPGGTIGLRAWAGRDEVHIAISDTGVGIAPHDQGRVFEKFQQVGDTLTGKPKGSGLGLTICREIVAQHSGQLTLASQLGRGSTFTISLPIVVAERTRRRAA